MVHLSLSILLSAGLFVLFKVFAQKGISLISAIVGNYVACIIVGLISAPSNSFINYNLSAILMHYLLGFLFFGTFLLMGKSTAINGIGITGMAGKMSLLLTVFILGAFANEQIAWVEILALVLGLLALIIMGMDDSKNLKLSKIWMPLLILIGSAVIDACLALLKQYQLKMNLDQSLGIVYTFAGALTLAILTNIRVLKSEILNKNGLLLGLILGCINYYSVHFLLLGIEHRASLTLNQFYLINNIGVVIVTFLIGVMAFRESTNWKRLLGLMLAILSIYIVLNH